MNPQENEFDGGLDRATAERLRRLRTMPVDTSRLERMLQSQIPRPRRQRLVWLRPLRAVAAGGLIALAVAAAALLSSSGGPVLASPSHVARVHEELVSGDARVTPVRSMEEAKRALSAEWPQTPGLPDLPQDHVHACCMKSLKGKQVACVLLKSDGVPVSLMVAKAEDMKLPTSPTRSRGGVTYHVQSTGGLNMVMAERGGRWVCLIGEKSAERLMDLAEQLEF